jgi:hypothetical protein
MKRRVGAYIEQLGTNAAKATVNKIWRRSGNYSIIS